MKKKKIIFIGILIAVLAALTAMGQPNKYHNIDDTKIALGGFSPVSYFEVG